MLTVWNEGDPIAEERVGDLFAPFWRDERSGRQEGLGLGLCICRQIVHAHGGELSVSSSAADGTSFMVNLPRQAAAAA